MNIIEQGNKESFDDGAYCSISGLPGESAGVVSVRSSRVVVIIIFQEEIQPLS